MLILKLTLTSEEKLSFLNPVIKKEKLFCLPDYWERVFCTSYCTGSVKVKDMHFGNEI